MDKKDRQKQNVTDLDQVNGGLLIPFKSKLTEKDSDQNQQSKDDKK